MATSGPAPAYRTGRRRICQLAEKAGITLSVINPALSAGIV